MKESSRLIDQDSLERAYNIKLAELEKLSEKRKDVEDIRKLDKENNY